MLAGCSSSTLLSPRHSTTTRLRSEASCHFNPLPSPMSTQRLDLPTSCAFPRKDTNQALRPVGLSVHQQQQQPADPSRPRPKPACSLKQNIRLPPLAATTTQKKNEFWEEKGNNKSLKKRLADPENDDEEDESFVNNRAKRRKDCWFQEQDDDQDRRLCFAAAPWVDSFVTKITNLGEKEGTTTTTTTNVPPPKEAAAASVSHNTSSESQSMSLRLNENESEHEQRNPYHYNHHDHDGTELLETGDEENQDEHRGFELVSLLAACVDAIASRNVAAVNCFIAKLGDLASPRGRTPISRVCSYFTEALALRVARMWPHVFHITAPRELDRIMEDESGTALRLLNQVTPIPKFLHFTSNEILLRAFEGKDRVHIIDFDIKQGLQWPSLFQSLASRPNPPAHVRVTGVGESKQELNETGDRLSNFAQALNLPFEFHPVVDRLEDVRLWMLHVKEHETVAVNCVFQLHKTLYDGSGGALRDFLGLIRSTNPSIVLIAEQETEHNGVKLESRVCNSLKYYSALFDSIDHCLPPDNPVRGKIEEMYGGEIRNIVACEGRERVERHEGFEKWRRMMEQGGFRGVGISEREMRQSEMLVKMYACGNYNVRKKEEGGGGGGITLGWLEQPVCTVSAWVPVDGGGAGSSSSYSQACRKKDVTILE
ncbi:scarecrow-like protein 28 [Senna tora]|uniref:Scarecrow-like protein 28 n=1 Tax=Senna tora TaxID=362788 RepID=A0A834SYB5_9FABA|nr:scarecrow-like protein 28 [Senna tora]